MQVEVIPMLINSDFMEVSLDVLMYLADYKMYGESSFVYQDKSKLYKVYEASNISMNDRKINGEALEYLLKTQKAGDILAIIHELGQKELMRKLSTMTAVANSTTAMTAVVNSSIAMTAVANSSIAMTAVANSATAMTAVANSATAMTAVANSKLNKAVTHMWDSNYQNVGVNRCIITGWKVNIYTNGTYHVSFNKLFYGSDFNYNMMTEMQNVLIGLDAPCQTKPLASGSNSSFMMTFRYIEIK